MRITNLDGNKEEERSTVRRVWRNLSKEKQQMLVKDYKKFSRQGLLTTRQSGGRDFTDHLRSNAHYNAALNCSFIPPFCFNDEQLREVLCHRAWRYVHHSRPAPTSWNYEAVNREATKIALAGHEIEASAAEIQHEMQDRHIAAIKRAGGYMELQASIAYRSWREGMPSTEVAVSLGVSPWMVRQSLRRLRAIAAKLGYEVGKRHHSFGDDLYNRTVSA
jgi:hypothetical protein